jgi:hypothetical protein
MSIGAHVSHHHLLGYEQQMSSSLFHTAGMDDGQFDLLLAVPNLVNKTTLFLMDVASIPDPLLDAYHPDTIKVSRTNNAEHAVLPLEHPRLKFWMGDCLSYSIVYKRNGLWLTKLDESQSGPCVKQSVVARLYPEDGSDCIIGTNLCLNPQQTCPRDEQGMASGEGYHLCQEVCQQPAHAEVQAIRQAGEKAKGALLYLSGHTYACGNCSSVAKEHNVHIVVDQRR